MKTLILLLATAFLCSSPSCAPVAADEVPAQQETPKPAVIKAPKLEVPTPSVQAPGDKVPAEQMLALITLVTLACKDTDYKGPLIYSACFKQVAHCFSESESLDILQRVLGCADDYFKGMKKEKAEEVSE